MFGDKAGSMTLQETSKPIDSGRYGLPAMETSTVGGGKLLGHVKNKLNQKTPLLMSPFGFALAACGGGGETTSSAVTTPSFSLIGTSSQGNSLSLDLSNLVDNSDTVNAAYEWYRDDVLVADRVDTEPETYELLQEDVGSQVHVVVNLTSTNDNLDGTFTTQSQTFKSFDSTAVQNINDPASGSLVVSGESSAGAKLSVNASTITDIDGMGNFDFTWFRNGEEITDLQTWKNDPVNNVELKHLIMSDSEIQDRMDVAGPEKVFKIMIASGGQEIPFNKEPGEATSYSVEPEAWHLEIINNTFAKIQNFIDLKIEYVTEINDADIFVIISPLPGKDALSGFGDGVGSSGFGGPYGSALMMSYQTGLPSPKHLETDMDLLTTYWQEHPEGKKDWEEIFIHEVGHMLGLEHPWDELYSDTDQAVATSDDPHTHTLMGYSNTGEEGWFMDIDIAALQSIWGVSTATESQFEVYQADIGDEIYAQVSFTDCGGSLETLVSDTVTIIA